MGTIGFCVVVAAVTWFVVDDVICDVICAAVSLDDATDGVVGDQPLASGQLLQQTVQVIKHKKLDWLL